MQHTPFYSQAPAAQLLQDPSQPALRVRLLRLDHLLHVVEPFLLQYNGGSREGEMVLGGGISSITPDENSWARATVSWLYGIGFIFVGPFWTPLLHCLLL